MALTEIEIQNFTLHYDGMYYIETEIKEQFRIHIDPYFLMLLFQNEGYQMNDIKNVWATNEKIPFTKAGLKLFQITEDGKVTGRCTTDFASYYEDKGVVVHYVELA